MGIEPTSPGQRPSVLSRLNCGNVRHARDDLQHAYRSGSVRRQHDGCHFGKSDGQVALLTEGLHLAGFEPAPLKLAPERSLAIKLPPPDGGG